MITGLHIPADHDRASEGKHNRMCRSDYRQVSVYCQVGTWGDHMALLAAAEAYRVRVRILTEGGERQTVVPFSGPYAKDVFVVFTSSSYSTPRCTTTRQFWAEPRMTPLKSPSKVIAGMDEGGRGFLEESGYHYCRLEVPDLDAPFGAPAIEQRGSRLLPLLCRNCSLFD